MRVSCPPDATFAAEAELRKRRPRKRAHPGDSELLLAKGKRICLHPSAPMHRDHETQLGRKVCADTALNALGEPRQRPARFCVRSLKIRVCVRDCREQRLLRLLLELAAFRIRHRRLICLPTVVVKRHARADCAPRRFVHNLCRSQNIPRVINTLQKLRQDSLLLRPHPLRRNPPKNRRNPLKHNHFPPTHFPSPPRPYMEGCIFSTSLKPHSAVGTMSGPMQRVVNVTM